MVEFRDLAFPSTNAFSIDKVSDLNDSLDLYESIEIEIRSFGLPKLKAFGIQGCFAKH